MSDGKISLSLGSRKKPALTNGVKRSHAALHDEEQEDVEGKAQTVSHFDSAAGGAVNEKDVKPAAGPLVIPAQKNRDWREASTRNKRLRYAQAADQAKNVNAAAGGDMDSTADAVESRKPAYGLNINKRSSAQEAEAINGDATSVPPGREDAAPAEENSTQEPLSADQEAMDALLGNKKASNLVLPLVTEEEAFERDYQSAPDMATLADYDRVPVEGFGAALMRGMGWKDGEGIGAKKGKKMEQTKLPQPRPSLLGIGAKPEAAVAGEIGAWGKVARSAGKNGEFLGYTPVLLRDKLTGEMLTEEEVEKRKAEDERRRYEMEFEEKEKERRNRGERRNGDGDRHSRRDDERRRDRDRDRRKHDDNDEEYYRRKKEKERRRRERDYDNEDRYADRDRNRERSRRQGSDRERHRDRQHDRRH